MHDLNNKTALITGASRGLGLYISRLLWSKGTNLILVARSNDRLQQLCSQLNEHSNGNQKVETISTDLAKPQIAAELITKLNRYDQQIHILINNAAIQGPIGPAWENDWQEWQNTLQVNLLTPITLCRIIIPKMIQQHYGKIINLSGGGATAARPNFSAYAVAKSGLVRFSETVAEEVKPFNISINCVAPGVMNTDMLTEIIQATPEKAGAHEFTQAKKKMTMDDSVIKNAAELCVFLASSQSDGITGKLISTIWDPWTQLPKHLAELQNSDIYTLRRIIPKDRGKDWGEPS